MEKTTIIAVANQKGGVGKTTTVINIGAGLKQAGKNVLLIDLDPQNHLSRYLGYTSECKGKATICDLLHQGVSNNQLIPYENFISYSTTAQIDYIAANEMLAGAIGILGIDSDSSNVLNRILENEFFSQYDYIIIDCKPALDLIVTNALKACDKLIVPVQAEFWSYEGVDQMLKILARTKGEDITPYIGGILLTMFRKNTKMSQSVLKAVKESYGDKVFKTPISLRAEVGNSTVTQVCLATQKNSPVGEEYRQVVKEFLGGKD